jgi:hypothetical protein
MDERRAVVARYCTRAAHGQRSGNSHDVLACRVTCLPGDKFGRDEYAAGQPKPSSPSDKAAKLSP